MAKRARVSVAKKPRKKSRYQKRGRNIPALNSLVTKRFVFKTTVAGSDVSSSAGGSSQFVLSDVPGYTEFTNMFDQYKLTGVRYRWVNFRDPTSNYNTASALNGVFPRVGWVHDYDESSTPGSFAQLQEYDTFREVYLRSDTNASRWFWIKPKFLRQLYQFVGTGYEVAPEQWLSTNVSSTPFYGLKYFYDGVTNGNQLRLECYYYLSFKSVK